MAYKSLAKLITAENKQLESGAVTSEEYAAWKENTLKKMDVFLACDRITDAQYQDLMAMFAE